ncbi:MAG: glycosyl transferase [Desulfobulbaceae bacterium]|nr:glycosyl transferase [Desulfobulbaceae bacterium]
MKILIYCQHVLGVGHLFRTLEIAGALHNHQVTLLLGGPPVKIAFADHIRVVQLPGLRMDAAFSSLLPTEDNKTLAEVKQFRQARIFSLVKDFQPDVMVIELFPFGRNGFSFELIPLLEAVRNGKLPSCKVVCSLRDILVEKKNPQKFEQRVIDRLNSLFDTLLVHGDPKVIPLDATFSRFDDITVPVIYTGYIAEKVNLEEAQALRKKMYLRPDEKLIVVSAGGGNVGYQLLSAAMNAFAELRFPARMQVFTGPYLDPDEFRSLENRDLPGASVERFADNFTSWLGAADLSVSMGGYNTTMNVLAAGTPALVFPFNQNHEQKMRAERLSSLANLVILDEKDLAPSVFADKITGMIRQTKKSVNIRLDGAEFTCRWLTEAVSGEPLT